MMKCAMAALGYFHKLMIKTFKSCFKIQYIQKSPDSSRERQFPNLSNCTHSGIIGHWFFPLSLRTSDFSKLASLNFQAL